MSIILIYRFGLLRHYYQEYDKRFHAGLCKKIAGGARDGDALCKWLMYQTGKVLGEYLAALRPTDVDSYIHRLGRTARGNNKSTASGFQALSIPHGRN